MRELLYDAAKHFKRGKALSERGDARGAMVAYEDALRDLHAVKPQRMRDVLLAQVYLSRYLLGRDADPLKADSDLRLGYSYARTTAEPTVRQHAEALWDERRTRPPVVPPRAARQGKGRRQGGERQGGERQGGERQAGERQGGERQAGDRPPGDRPPGDRGRKWRGERRQPEDKA